MRSINVRDGSKPWREIASDLLVAYKWPIVLAIGIGVVLVAWADPKLPTVEIPREAKVFAVAGLLAAGIGALPSQKIINWLYDPPKRYLVQPGFTVGEGGIWEMSPNAFSDLEVVGGSLYQWPEMDYPTYEVLAYDADRHLALGTWRGSASDGELLDREEELREVREELEAKARERDVLVTRAERIVRENVLENTRTLIQEYNRTTIVDVGQIQEDLDNAMEDVSLEGDLDRFKRSQESPETAEDDPRHEDDQPVSEPPSRAVADGSGGEDG